jgi:hypothetical protein
LTESLNITPRHSAIYNVCNFISKSGSIDVQRALCTPTVFLELQLSPSVGKNEILDGDELLKAGRPSLKGDASPQGPSGQ